MWEGKEQALNKRGLRSNQVQLSQAHTRHLLQNKLSGPPTAPKALHRKAPSEKYENNPEKDKRSQVMSNPKSFEANGPLQAELTDKVRLMPRRESNCKPL